jgi:hypothetical protein
MLRISKRAYHAQELIKGGKEHEKEICFIFRTVYDRFHYHRRDVRNCRCAEKTDNLETCGAFTGRGISSYLCQHGAGEEV